MKIVIAGASGLVGRNLCDYYATQDVEVIGLSRTQVDFSHYLSTFGVLKREKPDVLIVCAAKVGGIFENSAFPVDFLQENLLIELNILMASFRAEVERVIFLGSSCVYPRASEQPIREDYLLSGPLESTNSAYAVAKIAGIELINSYRRQYNKNWISLMPTNIYGPHDNFNVDKGHVIPALIRKFAKAKEDGGFVSVWGSGIARREFLHVYDLVTAIDCIVKTDTAYPLLNIGSGDEVSIKDLVSQIATLFDFTGEISWDFSKPDGTFRKLLDSTRVRQLGWEPEISLEVGLKSTIEWFLVSKAQGGVKL